MNKEMNIYQVYLLVEKAKFKVKVFEYKDVTVGFDRDGEEHLILSAGSLPMRELNELKANGTASSQTVFTFVSDRSIIDEKIEEMVQYVRNLNNPIFEDILKGEYEYSEVMGD